MKAELGVALVKEVEVAGYVLPTLGSYTAWVDVDADDFARRHAHGPCRVRIALYSPQTLSEGEMAEVSDALNNAWQNYVFEREREFPGIRNRWARWMGGADLTMVSAEAGMDFALGLGALGAFFASVLFWGFMIFAYSIGGLVRSIIAIPRRRRTRRLLRNWRGSTVAVGEEPQKQMLVQELNQYYSQLQGREKEIYQQLQDFCKEKGYEPRKFYQALTKRLEAKGDSFLLRRYPPHFRKRLRNLLLGPPLPPPVVAAPMRVMESR